MGDPFLDDHNVITTEDVVFSRADPELQMLPWRLNGEAWAAPISIEDYVAREMYLSRQDYSTNGRCTYWVLSHRDDRTHVVASCESVKKTVFIAGRGTGIKDGFVEGAGYAVANVYTNPKYRRLGMAAFMLQKLQEQMDAESVCSALYSDLGRVYYANLGWAVFPSDQATIFLQADKYQMPAATAAATAAAAVTKYLTLEELKPLCEKDVAAVKARFTLLSSDDTKTHGAFSPEFPQIAWQLAREQFMTEAMRKRPVQRRGAITNNGRSWIYWEHVWREEQLKVLRLVTSHSDPEAGVAVVEAQRIGDMIELLQAERWRRSRGG